MPTLKMIAACEKVIFDQDGPVSIISMFQKMKVQLSGAPLPEKAISPTMWNVFALWETEPREAGQEFTQMLNILAPDGTVFIEQEGKFKNDSATEPQIKIKIMVPGLPIWKEGWVTVRAWLKGSENSVGEYKFEVVYLPPQVAPSSESLT